MDWIEKRMSQVDIVKMHPLIFRCFCNGLGFMSGNPWLEDFKKANKKQRFFDHATGDEVFRWTKP